jgi:polyhydroxybutyrate depolymerase
MGVIMDKQRYSCAKRTYIIILLIIAFAKGYSLEQIKISVDGIQREIFLYVPAIPVQEKLPVVFVFHGYGQEVTEAINKFKLDQYWPEAIIVYPQGLNTAIQKMDIGGINTGWQTYIGDQKDRDIRLFDEIKVYLSSNYSIDDKRIYVTGFSNGAAFTYVVAAARGNMIAAIAPIAGTLGSNKDRKIFKEIPVFHVAGKQDEIVKFNSQKEMIEFIKRTNKCNDNGTIINKNVTKYKSTINMPLWTFIYDGEHKIPKDAIPFIVEFFKSNQLK